jgi:hypothetical protein
MRPRWGRMCFDVDYAINVSSLRDEGLGQEKVYREFIQTSK